jgi:threonine dehydratase
MTYAAPYDARRPLRAAVRSRAALDAQRVRRRIAPALVATPLVAARTLSQMVDAELLLKLELRQKTGAFKERGALNRLLRLRASGVVGVVTASAGNHAQGLAYHGARLGIPVTAVMPETTPRVKVDGVRRYGATVVLVPGAFEEAQAKARELAATRGIAFVPPFDDADVIAGQGTIAAEILDAAPNVTTIVVPVGGGGLAAGVAGTLAHLAPHVEVIGVRTLRATIAEGLNVAELGVLPKRMLARFDVPIVTVSERLLCEAMALHYTHDGLVVEPAGAAPLAAVLGYPERFRGKRTALVVSGGNVDRALFDAILKKQSDLAMRGLTFSA